MTHFLKTSSRILLVILTLSALPWAGSIDQFKGKFGMNPIKTPIANNQAAPTLQGLQLDNARGMFMLFDGSKLTLNIFGMEKSSTCSKLQVDSKAQKPTLHMQCTADDKTDKMIFVLQDGSLHMSKESDPTILVFDPLTNIQYQERMSKAKAALQVMMGM